MSDPSTNLDEATKLVVSDPERSLEICENFLESNPDNPRGIFCRFQAWDVLGKFENALADINRVIELEPDWVAYFSRGAFFHKFGHYMRAIDDLNTAQKLDLHGQGTTSIAWYRASALSWLGRLDEALADCKLLSEDHWMPEHDGLPGGNKQEFTDEIRRRAVGAYGP